MSKHSVNDDGHVWADGNCGSHLPLAEKMIAFASKTCSLKLSYVHDDIETFFVTTVSRNGQYWYILDITDIKTFLLLRPVLSVDNCMLAAVTAKQTADVTCPWCLSCLSLLLFIQLSPLLPPLLPSTSSPQNQQLWLNQDQSDHPHVPCHPHPVTNQTEAHNQTPELRALWSGRTWVWSHGTSLSPAVVF